MSDESDTKRLPLAWEERLNNRPYIAALKSMAPMLKFDAMAKMHRAAVEIIAAQIRAEHGEKDPVTIMREARRRVACHTVEEENTLDIEIERLGLREQWLVCQPQRG